MKGIIPLGIILLLFSSAAWAQDISKEFKVDHKVIIILEKEGLVPNVVMAKRGTTVIWINYSDFPKEIKFLKEQVKTACRNPLNFFVNKSGVFQSNKLSTGAVASLCFIDKGEFEYQLEYPKGEDRSRADAKRLKGVVKVY